MRLLAGAGATITLETFDASGAPADVVDEEVPEVSIADSGGTEVATPTGERTGEGAYAAVLPTSLAILDRYAATWSWSNGAAHVRTFELVRGFLFSVPEVRAFDSAFADADKYPAATIRARREVVEDRFATAMRISPTPRGNRERLDGSGDEELFVTLRRLQALTFAAIDGTELIPDELAAVTVADWKLIRPTGKTWARGSRNVVVRYDHGMVEASAPLVEAGLRYVRHLLGKRSFNDERMTAIEVGDTGGFFRVSTAGPGRPTGIPDVDAVLADEGMALGAFG